MANGDQPWSERTGIDEYDELMNPLRRWGWPMNAPVANAPTEGEGTPAARKPEAPRHRIVDDMNTAGNRSGGPAGTYAEQLGRERITGLRGELAQATAPPPKPSLGRSLLREALNIAPTLAAAATGKPGAAQGADQALQRGVARRQQQADLEKTRQFETAQRLRQEIEQESLEQERGARQYQTESMREEMQQRGLTERELLAQRAEDARWERLQEQGRQKIGQIGAREEASEQLEDKRQMGRMQLQALRNQGAQLVAKIHAATSQGRVPPPVAKAADDFQASQTRLDVMQKSYDSAIKDPGNQQAMLNLLANHIGMTMGGQKGARITQSVIDEAKRSGYIDERIEAHFGPDGLMTGVVLTPRQMSQMVTLAQDKIQEDYRRMSDWEAYTGFRPQAPMRPQVPPSATGGGAGGGKTATGAAGGPKPAQNQLQPPGPAPEGMKWQHRLNKGKIEWRTVANQQ